MARRPGVPTVWIDPTKGLSHQYSFTVNGVRYRGSTGKRDHGEAQAEAERLYAKALLGNKPPVRVRGAVPSPEEIPLEQHFALFIDSITGKKSRGYIVKMESHFRANFSHRWTRLADLTAQAIDRYSTERLAEFTRLKKPTSTVTLHKELVTLRRFLKWCRKQGLVETVPSFESIKPVSGYVPPDYTTADVVELLAAIPDRHTHRRGFPAREYFTVQWAQALRPDAELGSLRWCDVDLDKRTITIRQSQDKAREGRVIAMAEEAHRVLSKMKAEIDPLPTALIFGRRNFRRSLELAAEAVGKPKAVRHHLRHFRLTELGHSPATAPAALKYFAGHKHLATTDRYLRTRTKATTEMLAALAPAEQPAKKATKKRNARRGS